MIKTPQPVKACGSVPKALPVSPPSQAAGPPQKVRVAEYTPDRPRILITIDHGEGCAKYRVVEGADASVSCVVERGQRHRTDAMGGMLWERVGEPEGGSAHSADLAALRGVVSDLARRLYADASM